MDHSSGLDLDGQRTGRFRDGRLSVHPRTIRLVFVVLKIKMESYSDL